MISPQKLMRKPPVVFIFIVVSRPRRATRPNAPSHAGPEALVPWCTFSGKRRVFNDCTWGNNHTHSSALPVVALIHHTSRLGGNLFSSVWRLEACVFQHPSANIRCWKNINFNHHFCCWKIISYPSVIEISLVSGVFGYVFWFPLFWNIKSACSTRGASSHFDPPTFRWKRTNKRCWCIWEVCLP